MKHDENVKYSNKQKLSEKGFDGSNSEFNLLSFQGGRGWSTTIGDCR